MFFIISVITFEVNIVAEQKQAQLANFFVFDKFPLPTTFLVPRLLFRFSSAPVRNDFCFWTQ